VRHTWPIPKEPTTLEYASEWSPRQVGGQYTILSGGPQVDVKDDGDVPKILASFEYKFTATSSGFRNGN
jgi:hypothetical protein